MTKFCTHCGAGLAAQPPVKCANCDSWTFVVIKSAASAVIVRDNHFLAVKRSHAPAAGEWDIPGGFCEAYEHPTHTAIREVKEETGLDVQLGSLIGVYCGEYAYQGDVNPTLDFYYFAHLTTDQQPLTTTNETSDAEWLPLHNPPQLAFPYQQQVIHDAWSALKLGS